MKILKEINSIIFEITEGVNWETVFVGWSIIAVCYGLGLFYGWLARPALTPAKEGIKALADRLEYYNNWRRQDCGPYDPERLKMPDTKQLGKDIDSAIELLRELAESKS